MRQRLLLIALLPALLALLLAGSAGVWGVHVVLLPPPFAYRDAAGVPVRDRVATYPAENPLLCAGDALHYTIFLNVTEAPVIIAPYAKIMRLDTGRAVPPWGPLNPPVPYATPVNITARLAQPIPPTLPPGRYAFEVVGQAEGRLFNGFRVLFTVRGDCTAPIQERGR